MRETSELMAKACISTDTRDGTELNKLQSKVIRYANTVDGIL
jgi:hypothetical protein